MSRDQIGRSQKYRAVRLSNADVKALEDALNDFHEQGYRLEYRIPDGENPSEVAVYIFAWIGQGFENVRGDLYDRSPSRGASAVIT